ncbi:ribonucleoside-triphosphate reductase, adenosylcobalamin-dependent [Limnothrix sp. FACHB-708]|uniref:ribonucleoside-triphosphate reductase, adenosylcobalamin-dependent n=1 Tax=unclassified Limnothrix TaxID=2632864 RepID=UPI0016875299|nr:MULTISPECIES: ribonucleoside-triphosphate reductase, adenosylcobalamin-dependent [unclassified Limnothrix]MBD2554474.1 ribonucleoside-triphosphate reductase, adenosylcobalamin-dependent [Limnothrix sp. FACHB-708]MBD2589458.1 ribonucleoside-triphosphate reductase, adenosylcobalamin-dependent [Limnothrix sp. FACHB-406]
MVQELNRAQQQPVDFPDHAPTAYPVFYRTYSRRMDGERESWQQTTDRTLRGLVKLGNLSDQEASLLDRMQKRIVALPSGRWLWVGGTDWLENPQNFSGAYNCTSTNVIDWKAFGLMMDLAMMGCGTGGVLEPRYIEQLPPVRNSITVTVTGELGTVPVGQRLQETTVDIVGNAVRVVVGDSRQGWVKSYQTLLDLCSDERFDGEVQVAIDLSNVRPAGETLRGFGGVANPIKLPELYDRVTRILNRAIGRQLTSVECCLLIDEAAVTIVAGNIRRSAGMRQFNSTDELGAKAKDNLWQQDEAGNWRIDPDRDSLRMANHTRVFHQKPTETECIDAVRKQFYSGEGAIQWAGEAIARSNADLIAGDDEKKAFILAFQEGNGKKWLAQKSSEIDEKELIHRLERIGLNPCGEILGSDFHCNLSEIHLNQIDPKDYKTQEDAFKAGALSVAGLLNHRFQEERYQYSRSIDPIVGVSFTGLFDFFVQAFGVDWLRWWEAGRPDTVQGLEFKDQERQYLNRWREIVHQTVWDYCDRHGLRRPNRCTTVQPSGTKSLLTGASPGWHPPKAARFIRRITFRKNDPVALACLDYGYSIVPSQSDKDENGNLLNDPFDPRCTEWLVEIPVAVSWADLPGADTIAIEQFSALAQFDFYMQVQTHYTTHNTSATIELREPEIEPLGRRIHQAIQNDEGYISAALLARFDDLQTFPRLPFEPISRETYQEMHDAVLQRRRISSFHEALRRYDKGEMAEAGPAGCDSDKCLLPETKG